MPAACSEITRRLRAYQESHEAAFAQWKSAGYPRDFAFPVHPDDLRNISCEARTRSGTPCKRTDIYIDGRCKLHGGLSTGPTTEAGKASARANLALRWSEPHEGL